MASSIPDTAASSRSQSPKQFPKDRRPARIAELEETARESHGWDPNVWLKDCLRTAEKYRRHGNSLVKSGDLEPGFIELSKAAILIMEKVPTHRHYRLFLNHNLRKDLRLVSDIHIGT